MALRNILNRCAHKLKPYRQFSSSTLISKNFYNSSLPILSTPWLMLPPDVKDGPNGPTDNYLNIIDKSIIKIDRPTAHGSVPFNTMCVGSAKGWVAFECDSDGSLFLANPYATEARCRKLPGPSAPIYSEGLHFTLAGDPMSNNFALIMRQTGFLPLLISKGGDSERWIYGAKIDYNNGLLKRLETEYSISRMAYNRKSNTVYELHLDENSGKLEIICWYPLGDDENGKKKRVLSSCLDPKVVKKYHEFEYEDSVDRNNVDRYLAVTEQNDPRLFLVIRPTTATENGVGCETKDIELFEIDLEGDGKVECVESIGDRALFLGANSDPFFISTRDCSGIKSNCVYVAEELGYYDLETKCKTPFLSLGDLANTRPQVYWVAPPFFG
ncbi:uncharacterized protein LOC141655976 [Silene latifolia]|uniref:uncharacterized protein LOC141655976 n=1 Tax=Silene latifolia TaxID=37657 RepID=UPI003D7705EB